MLPTRLPATPVWLALSCLALAWGCHDAESDPLPAPPARRTPEERFERFLTELKRWVENDPTTADNMFADSSATGSLKVEVTHEITPPETEKGVYRAKVVIAMRSSLTLLTIPAEERTQQEEPTQQEEEAGEFLTPLTPGDDPPEADVSGGPASRFGYTAPPIHTVDTDEIHEYDFAYVDGRWRLKTELDPEGRDAMFAQPLELALKRQ